MARACVARYAALTRRSAHFTASLRGVFQTLRRDVGRAVARFSAAQCGTRACAMLAPKTGASMVRACVPHCVARFDVSAR
eukprot:11161344-Lingulodinium_polyedra.AAC.1